MKLSKEPADLNGERKFIGHFEQEWIKMGSDFDGIWMILFPRDQQRKSRLFPPLSIEFELS
jgi:hypothetical protein